VPTEAVEQGNFWWQYAEIQGQQQHTEVKNISGFQKLTADAVTEKIELLKNHYKLERSCIDLDELKKLASSPYINIGSHTVTHPFLNRCTFDRQKYEMEESRNKLESWLGEKVEYIAYPGGEYDNDSLTIARDCHYKLGFSCNLGKVDVHSVDPYMIPRHGINDDGGTYENIAKILGVWQKIYFENTILSIPIKSA
jgi:peptidoglycan/xylan/chitin deacetylase (PgdA/CDA1 family)